MRKLIFVSLSALYLNANAQKLPNVQQVSLHVPANIKIDGKTDDWGSNLQAYNKATNIFYSIANDGENLYMVVQARDIVPIQKIISGGLTVTFKSANKKDTNSLALTYPLNGDEEKPAYLTVMNKPQPQTDTAAYQRQIDNFRTAGNKLLANSVKFIGVIGFKNINDEKISIYNTEGITVAAQFDPAIYYNFEIAIPLKLLKSNIASAKLIYNVRVNGITNHNTNLKAISRNTFYILTYKGSDGKNYMLEPASPDLVLPTDFWGEYTLAK